MVAIASAATAVGTTSMNIPLHYFVATRAPFEKMTIPPKPPSAIVATIAFPATDPAAVVGRSEMAPPSADLDHAARAVRRTQQ